MDSFRALIDRFGVATLRDVLGVSDMHIRQMKARNSIPTEYWGALVEAAPAHQIQGVDLALLHRLRLTRFSASTPRSASVRQAVG